MSDPVLEKLDELTQEIRRQGRAAIAAQAAAEACLKAVTSTTTDDADADTNHWLVALLPTLDGLGRAREQARELAVRAKSTRRLPFFAEWPKEDLVRLASGIDLICRELDDALDRLGVDILAPRSGKVDSRLARVVETRASAGNQPGHVLELVRRGYSIGERVIREADVVASR